MTVADLKMTPARLALLRAIATDLVWEEWYNDEPGDIDLRVSVRKERVTGRVRVMKIAGMCRTDPSDADLDVRRIVLTDAGAKVLASHDKEAQR